MVKWMAMERLIYQMLIFWLMIDASVCNICSGQLTCGDCIRQAGCTWCSDKNFPTGPRCQPFLLQNFCPLSSIIRPQSSVVEIISATTASSVNISKVALNLTVGDSLTFKVAVTPQKDPDLDVYILTNRLRREVMALQVISSNIVTRLSAFARSVRLGLGDYNDKLSSPHHSTFIDRDIPISPTERAFTHYVSLTNNVSEFSSAFLSVPERTAVEAEENGLDALAQVITCKNIIGWQAQARIVVMVTSRVQHIAGEGRISGILTPYDGTCLLERTNTSEPVKYSRSEEFDFPSFGQVRELLRDFGVVAIFAVSDTVMLRYESVLSSLFSENSLRVFSGQYQFPPFTTEKTTERELLEIIESQSLRAMQTVSLDTTGSPSFISLEVTPSCPTNSRSILGGVACDRVSPGSTVDFTVVATLNTCEGLINGQVLNFSISSPAHGSFDVSITVTCDCECARSGERSPDDCSGMGVRSCGVCECDADQCGRNCEVPRTSNSTSNCLRGAQNNLLCSGRGSCDCNDCICDTFGDGILVHGDACECDNFRCPSTGSSEFMEVCSGPDRGKCCDSRCICLNSPHGNPYHGDGQVNNCQCEPEEEVCMDPQTGTMCNGRGTCGCNSCICDDPIQYSGVFCEILNAHVCGFERDLECIARCIAAVDETSLPSVCSDSCIGNRPIIIIEDETSLEDIAFLLGDDVGEFTTSRGSCERQNQLYFILNNGSHFYIAALRNIIERHSVSLVAASVPSIIELLIIGALIAFGVFLHIQKKKGIQVFWRKGSKGSQNSILPSDESPCIEEKNLLIPGHYIKLQDTIGQGCFGVVHKGHLYGWQGRTELVAIKILRSISKNDYVCLINDSEKFTRLDHLHVLSLIGICTELGKAPYIILPYMANGSLLRYLLEERSNLIIAEDASNEMICDAMREFLSMCLQIALGMSYLSDLGIAHGLLSARNCMVNEDFVIKVADYGLSFLLKKGQLNESENLPIQWMAPECIRHNVFTEKSDVWSFGVTCWEVFSLGDTPYSGMDHAAFIDFVNDGLRLLKPKHPACSKSVYKEIMSNCWIEKPNKRPTFEMLTKTLDVLVEGLPPTSLVHK